MNTVDKTLLSGSMGTMLLKLLSEKDMYGYEMIETLRSRSENVFELKAGTLYPLLHTLEGKNYLTSYEKEVLGKMRKYYSITKDGRKYLKGKLEEWETYTAAVANVLAYEM
jgi:DNA-binding PadR family transcriptional regulator